jgi:hypothetical protein
VKRLGLAACVVLGAVLGAIAGHREAPAVRDDQAARSRELRDEVETLRTRFAVVKRELDTMSEAGARPAAATAAREKLFQLRVDLIAVEDELAVLAGRRAVAR